MGRDGGEKLTIFLVEEDDETRSVLRQNLKRAGYKVLLALDEEDALDRGQGGNLRADLVLVNLVGKSVDEALHAGRRIREQAGLDGVTPLVIMADQYGPDVEGTDMHAGGNDWITYPDDSDQLHRLLRRLTGAS